jgi:hypothetical protein
LFWRISAEPGNPIRTQKLVGLSEVKVLLVYNEPVHSKHLEMKNPT